MENRTSSPLAVGARRTVTGLLAHPEVAEVIAQGPHSHLLDVQDKLGELDTYDLLSIADSLLADPSVFLAAWKSYRALGMDGQVAARELDATRVVVRAAKKGMVM